MFHFWNAFFRYSVHALEFFRFFPFILFRRRTQQWPIASSKKGVNKRSNWWNVGDSTELPRKLIVVWKLDMIYRCTSIVDVQFLIKKNQQHFTPTRTSTDAAPHLYPSIFRVIDERVVCRVNRLNMFFDVIYIECQTDMILSRKCAHWQHITVAILFPYFVVVRAMCTEK